MKLVIIDYGSGNLHSAQKAVERAGRQTGIDLQLSVTSDVEKVRAAERIILPGVGAFGDCRDALASIPGMIDALNETVIEKARPFLGICVGMQLMASAGLEHGRHKGLDWIKGAVEPITIPEGSGLKIPHMGWNALEFEPGVHPLLDGFAPGTQVYFVHSFHFVPEDKNCVLATTEYSARLTAIVGRDNMVGCQFHPEKSQRSGMKILQNFLAWTP